MLIALAASLFVCAISSLATAPAAAAQRPRPAGTLPPHAMLQFQDDAYTVFGRRDGIPDAPILWLQPGADGKLLLATAEGAREFDGRRWTVLATPPQLPRQTIRVVLERANGDRVFVVPSGVVTESGGRYSPFASLPRTDFPLYSAVAVPLQDGGDEVIVGTRGGGVARRRDGAWTRWGPADGLQTLAVEQVALAPPGDTLTALAATSGGAFALHENRWVPIGPRITVTQVLRVQVGAHFETWLGTFGGELYRSARSRDASFATRGDSGSRSWIWGRRTMCSTSHRDSVRDDARD